MGPFIYRPAPEPEPVWTVDNVGDVIATVVIFALIAVVGVASLWDRFA